MSDLLTPADMAELAGITLASFRRARSRHTVPPPDGRVGRSDVWHRETAETWAQRPRQPNGRRQSPAPAAPTTAPDADHADPVGVIDIAARLGRARHTVALWHSQGTLPAARWRVSGAPAWDWADVHRWAVATGRLSAS